ncbi:hypothetical protein AAXE64_27195 [Priestia megaterium]
MSKNLNGSQEDSLNYKDSWAQNTVELAALGAIVTGAGTLAIRGDLNNISVGGKRALGAMGKGFENYIRRKGSPGSKFGMQVGKKTFFKLKKMDKPTPVDGSKHLNDLLSDSLDKVENDPAMKERIRREVARRLTNETTRESVDNVLDGNTNASRDEAQRIREIYQKVVSEMVKRDTGVTPPPKKPRTKLFGSNNDGKPLFDKKELARDAVGSGLAGLAFGGGLSGFHALDRLVADKDNQQKLEDSFGYAGSFLPNKEEKPVMDKAAGSLEFYNRMREIGRKTPEAVATGLGFTGVSLGAAKVMNDQKQKNGEGKDDKPKGSRVIIELGSTDASDDHNLGNHPTNMMGSLPKLSSEQSDGLFSKVAFKPPGNTHKLGLGQFVNDLLGHKKQINEIKDLDPADLAASELKHQNIPSLLKERYGNLVNDKTEGQFTQRLYDSKTNEVKKSLDDQVKGLETRTADARLKAGAGTLAVGGLAGVGGKYLKERNQNGETTDSSN